MIITDRRCGWSVEGMHVATLAANEIVNDKAMLSFYGCKPGEKHYDELRRPQRWERFVVLKPIGTFVIVPMNPDVYVAKTPRSTT